MGFDNAVKANLRMTAFTLDGGSIEKTFTLTEKAITPDFSAENCYSNLNGSSVALVILAIAVIYLLNKRSAKRA